MFEEEDLAAMIEGEESEYELPEEEGPYKGEQV